MSEDKKSDLPLVLPNAPAPLASLGGLVTTLNHYEAVRIDVGSGILISVDRSGTSHSNFRLRILAERCFTIKRMSAQDVQELIRTLKPRRRT